MRPGLAKIIEKVRISTYYESAETDLHIAENACCIDYADTWMLKRVHWLSKSQSLDRITTHYGCEDTLKTRHWRCSSVPTDCVNSPRSCLKTQSIATTSCSPQLRMSKLLSSMWWIFNGRSGAGPFGCRNGIPLLCITSSLSTMTFLITWMAWCELWPRKRHNGRKTYSSLWSVRSKGYLNIILKSLQWLVCSSWQHTSSIPSGNCGHFGSGTRAWISILKKRLLILPNTSRPFWSMWRTNTAQNIDDCRSLCPITHWTTISAPSKWLLDLVNLLMIHTTCPAMTTKT